MKYWKVMCAVAGAAVGAARETAIASGYTIYKYICINLKIRSSSLAHFAWLTSEDDAVVVVGGATLLRFQHFFFLFFFISLKIDFSFFANANFKKKKKISAVCVKNDEWSFCTRSNGGCIVCSVLLVFPFQRFFGNNNRQDLAEGVQRRMHFAEKKFTTWISVCIMRQRGTSAIYNNLSL